MLLAPFPFMGWWVGLGLRPEAAEECWFCDVLYERVRTCGQALGAQSAGRRLLLVMWITRKSRVFGPEVQPDRSVTSPGSMWITCG